MIYSVDSQAQIRGGIRGRILDEGSGDPVPFARVKLLKTDDALVQSVVANDKGDYYIGNLLPGDYTLLAESQGFSALKLTQIPLQEGEWLEVPLHFAGETFEMDTLVEIYQPATESKPKNNPKNKPPKEKKPRKTAAERRLEREAQKLD